MLLALLAPLMPGSARAQFQTAAAQAFLMDAETGAVLYQKQADALVPPASMSKLVTLAVVFKALKEGSLKLEDQFTVSTNAWRTGGAPSGTSAMFLPIKARVTVADLIQGIIVQSGNDACIVLAEGMAQSEAAFVKAMQAYVRRIGLARSTFANSTGLPAEGHLMTARELGMLARHLIVEYPDYYPWFGQKEFKFLRHRFMNRNPLLFLNAGFDGMKTGQISESGLGIVASAQRDGRRLIAVLNGLKTKDDRKNEALKLVDWGFKSFAPVKLYEAGEIVGKARVWGGGSFYVPVTGNGDVSVLMPRFVPRSRYNAELVYMSPLKAPIRRGDPVATLRVTTQAGTVSEVPLLAAEDVERSSIWRRGLDSLVHLAFRWVPL